MSHAQFTIPEGFPELLQDYTITVLRERPSDIVEHAATYFTNLANHRNPNRLAATSNGAALAQESVTTIRSGDSDKKGGVKFSEDHDEGVYLAII